MPCHTDLKGLRVAVTGGTSGLGLALVRQLAAHGARVAFVARTADGGRARPPRHRRHRHRRRRRPQGRHPPDRAADHRQPRRPRRPDQQRLEPRPGAAGAARRHRLRGPGAGARRQPRRPVPPDQGAASARSPPRRATAAARVVVNISSDAAVNAYPGWGAYGASKAALAHLTAIWAEEATADGIRFLSIDPGDMDTPLHALAVPDADPLDAEAPGGRGGRDHRRDPRRCLPRRASVEVRA